MIISCWNHADITERCLNSFNRIEGLNPEFYIWENDSPKTKEIEKVVLSNKNVKGYIRFKENTVYAQLFAADYFLPLIKEKYVLITDGDLIIYPDSIMRQLELIEGAGIVSQKCLHLGKSTLRRKNDKSHLWSGIIYDEKKSYTRTFINGLNCSIALRQDWLKFVDDVLNKNIKINTCEPFNMGKKINRPPIFLDTDIYRYFEQVLRKRSLVLKGWDCYDMSEEKKPQSEDVYKARSREFVKISMEETIVAPEYEIIKQPLSTTLEEQYEIRLKKRSDINEHLPTLKMYAEKCETILELGVRGIVSTYAFLMGKPKKITSVDIDDPRGDVELCLSLAKKNNIDLSFVKADSRKWGSPEDNFDLIFIDTLHQYSVLKEELKKQGNKANKYIIFHDTATYGTKDEGGSRSGFPQGLLPAINEFLEKNTHWKKHEVFKNNNGLTVLKKI